MYPGQRATAFSRSAMMIMAVTKSFSVPTPSVTAYTLRWPCMASHVISKGIETTVKQHQSQIERESRLETP